MSRALHADGHRSLYLWLLEGNPTCGLYAHPGELDAFMNALREATQAPWLEAFASRHR